MTEKTIAEVKLSEALIASNARLNFVMMIMMAPDSHEARAYDNAVKDLGYTDKPPKHWETAKSMMLALVDHAIEEIAAEQAEIVDALEKMPEDSVAGELFGAAPVNDGYMEVSKLYPVM